MTPVLLDGAAWARVLEITRLALDMVEVTNTAATHGILPTRDLAAQAVIAAGVWRAELNTLALDTSPAPMAAWTRSH